MWTESDRSNICKKTLSKSLINRDMGTLGIPEEFVGSREKLLWFSLLF